MTDVRISDLPAASAVADTDITIIDDGVTTRRATGKQMRAGLLRSVVFDQILGSSIEPTAAALGLFSIAGLMWHDTSSGILKKRDQADTAWIDMGYFDETTKKYVIALPPATTTVAGISREATTAEAASGTSTTPSALPHVTPEGVAAALAPVKDRTTALETAKGKTDTVDIAGLSQFLFSNIPPNATKIRIYPTAVVMPGTATTLAAQLITSDGVISSGYAGTAAHIGSAVLAINNSTFIGISYPLTGNYLDVTVELVRFSAAGIWKWSVIGGLGTAAFAVAGGGHVSAGEVTGIKLYAGGGVPVQGKAFIEWEK